MSTTQEIIYGPTNALPVAVARAAMRTVAHNADDAEDCAHLLRVLGLMPPAAPSPATYSAIGQRLIGKRAEQRQHAQQASTAPTVVRNGPMSPLASPASTR